MGAFQGDVNGNLKINCIVGCSSTGGTSSAFGATFPANGTAEGLQYLATAPTLTNGQMVAGQTDINGNQKINCVVGCAGGTTSNASSTVATSSTNGATVSWLYAFNGSTWDQLQDDANKNLKVVPYQGANPLSATNGGFTNILQGNAVVSSSNPIFTQLTASSASIGNVGITGTSAFNLSQYNGTSVGAANPVYIAPGTGSLFAENTSQIGGNAILTGTGAAGSTGSGAARVAVSTDSPGGALANAAFNKITDGTNTAAVKAASTNPASTDPAVVVTISPNNASALATSALQSTANTALSAIQTAVTGPIPTQADTVSIGGVGVLGPLGPAIAPTAAVAVTQIPGTYSITSTPQAVEGGSYLLSAYETGGSWTGASVTVTSAYSSGQTQTISQSGGSAGPFTSNTASYCVQIGQGATVAYSGTTPTGTFTVTLAGSPGCVGSGGGSSSTVAQGTAAALSGAWPLEITDGTHGPVAVKAASTAPASTDPSLVVSLSPNSQGANLSTALFTKNTDGTNVAGVAAASTPSAYTAPALVVDQRLATYTLFSGNAAGTGTSYSVPGACYLIYANATTYTSGTITAVVTSTDPISNNTTQTTLGPFSSATATTAISLGAGVNVQATVTTTGSFSGLNVRMVGTDPGACSNGGGSSSTVSIAAGGNTATVKAASTPPAYTDPALVTASLPVGLSTLTNGSSTLNATALTYNLIIPANSATKGCVIQNPPSNTGYMYIYWDTTGTSKAPSSSLTITPGNVFQCNGNGYVIQSNIYAASNVASLPYFESNY